MNIQKLNVFKCAYANIGYFDERNIISIIAGDFIIREGWWSEYCDWSDRQWDDSEYRDLAPDSDLVAEWSEHNRERNA